MTHSPLPWTYHNINGVKDWIEDAHGSIQIENIGRIDGPLIVRAVNAHKGLMYVLENAVIHGTGHDWRKLANAALKLARGEA